MVIFIASFATLEEYIRVLRKYREQRDVQGLVRAGGCLLTSSSSIISRMIASGITVTWFNSWMFETHRKYSEREFLPLV